MRDRKRYQVVKIQKASNGKYQREVLSTVSNSLFSCQHRIQELLTACMEPCYKARNGRTARIFPQSRQTPYTYKIIQHRP